MSYGLWDIPLYRLGLTPSLGMIPCEVANMLIIDEPYYRQKLPS